MPWTTIAVNQNTEVNTLVSLTAEHDSGFFYTKERVNLLVQAEIDLFVSDAKAALVVFNTRRTRHDTRKTTILTALNL